MAEQGVDIAGDWGDDEFGAAIEVLEEQIAYGQIRQVKGNSYKEDLISGDAVAVIGWSGRHHPDQLRERRPVGVRHPGGRRDALERQHAWCRSASPHKKNAETLMNYYYDPEVAAEVAAYVNYICPVEGAKEAMQEIDPELAEDTDASSRTTRRSSKVAGALDDRRRGDRVRRSHSRRRSATEVADGGLPAAGRSDEGRDLELRQVRHQAVRRLRRRRRPVADDPVGVVLRPPGPVRVRQDDDAADGRRAGAPDRAARCSSAATTSPPPGRTSAR